MAELTQAQKKAIAIAKARLRLQKGAAPTPPEPQAEAGGFGFDDLISFKQTAAPFSPEAIGTAFQGLDDSVRMLAGGATLGFADKIAAKGNEMMGFDSLGVSDLVTGQTPLSRERAKTAAAKERLGPQGDVLEMAGSMLPATKALQLGMTATRIPGMTRGIGKGAGNVIDGATFGVLQSLGNDQDVTTGGLLGGVAGAAGGLLGKAGEKLLSKRALTKMQKAAPSFEKVGAEKDALYGALENAGVKFDSISYTQTVDDIVNRVSGFRARAPFSAELAEDLAKTRGMSPGFRDIEDILSEAKGIFREKNATDADKKAAGYIVDELSRYFDSAPLMTNGTVPAGQIAPLAKRARELARRHILAKDIKEMERKADWYVSGRESGMRNQAASYGKRRGKGLTEAEEVALKRVALREGARDWLTKAGSGLSQHILPAFLGSVGTLAGPIGTVGGAAAGYGVNLAARKASERVADKSVKGLLSTVLAGRSAQKAAKPSPRDVERLERAIKSGLLGSTTLLLQN